MDQANVLIIGGGVVGCATAYALSQRYQDVFLVEQTPRVGMATSSRNSGVIHSGIYYHKDSLKARHCVAGNRMMYEFCEKHKVPYRHCGKLVVATNEQETEALSALKKKGENNGVEGLRLVGPDVIKKREPYIRGVAALDVPSTGIVSSEDLVRTYARLASEKGAHVVTRAKVVALEPKRDTIRVSLRIGDENDAQDETIEARCVINAAGLYSDEIAAMLGNKSWKIYPLRGEYAEIRGPKARTWLINALVYPMPHAHGLSLGVHFTKTLWGTVLLGPTAIYVEGKDNYERGRLGIADFVKGAKDMLPEVEESDLQLGYSGLRPKIVPPDATDAHGDFIIMRDPKVPNAVQLVGIESPGLTSAPSIAEQATQLAAEVLA
jgi:glycerol-3-phosphate dehydrogenase